MKVKHNPEPWKVLDKYRGEFFDTEWPSVTQMFYITEHKFSKRICFKQFVPELLELTYGQVRNYMERVAMFLEANNIKKGDRIGLTGKNSVEWGIAYLGIIACGAVVCPVDYSLTDAEIEHLLDYVEIKGLFVDGERFDKLGKDGKYPIKISLEPKDHEKEYILNLPDVPEDYKPSQIPQSSDTCAFLFTSGTTGVPKAAMITHENIVSDCFLAQGVMNINHKEVFYAILPLHHAYTMLAVFIETLSCGSQVIFGKKLVVSQMLKEMDEGKVNIFLAVPMVYNKLLAGIMKEISKKGKFVSALVKVFFTISGFFKRFLSINISRKIFRPITSKVSLYRSKYLISGGGPLPEETFTRFNQMGLNFVQGYGLTETSPIVTLNPIKGFNPKSIGKPLPRTDIRIINKDEDGNGEIIVKGPMVMKGYYNNPEATAEIIDKDGYLHTGDVGYIDNFGYVFLTGRAKNLIVTEGGKNVFPEEIEDHFQLYDDIEQICVVGFEEDKIKKIEGVGCIIYPSSSCSRKIGDDKEKMLQHIQEIVDKVNEELLPYKRIRHIIIADKPLETTSTKKIKRFVVIKEYKSLLHA